MFLEREALLPLEMKEAPLDAATAQLFDVNGGLLPITGTVTLTLRVGTYSTPVTCGVVRCMSVPLLLGTDYTDVHVPCWNVMLIAAVSPDAVKKQNSRYHVSTEFEPPTPGRDPKVTPYESGSPTSH